MKSALAYLEKQNPVMLSAGAALVLFAVYYIGRKAIGDAAGVVGGIVSGDNAATRDTPYEGTGIVGTVGAIANAASGGLFERLGSWFGSIGNNDAGENLYYTITFPDGKRHAIGSRDISSSGRFEYGGAQYVVKVDPTTGAKYAFKV